MKYQITLLNIRATIRFISIFLITVFSGFSVQGNVCICPAQQVSSSGLQIASDANEVLRIPIRKKYPNKDFILQDYADIEYIPLETRSDVLLDRISSLHYYVSDSLIITYMEDGSVVVFNRSGRILHAFNHRGRGPGEYWELRAMTVDFEREELYVFDYPLYYRIRVYAFDGAYKRTIGTPGGMAGGLYFCNYGDYLLCYDRTNDRSIPDKNGKIANLNLRPYFLLSKKNGSVVKLNIRLKNFVSGSVITKIDGGRQTVTSPSGFYPLCKNGNQVYITDGGLDTIYQLRGMTAVPFMVKTPSVEGRDPALLAWIRIKTSRFTFLQSVEKRYTPAEGHFSSPLYPVYDHKSGEFYDSSMACADANYLRHFVSLDLLMDELPENYAKAILYPVALLKAYDEGRLRGRLKEIASQLKEDDNPVLMLVKFRD